jgi:hypothetical protein
MEVFEEWPQAVDHVSEELEGGFGIAEFSAGSHRLEQVSGLSGLRRFQLRAGVHRGRVDADDDFTLLRELDRIADKFEEDLAVALRFDALV